MRIFITTDFEALHKWANAPEKTSFLRSPHRHLFKVRLEMEVMHNDREVEFFDAKDNLQKVIATCVDKYDAGSCEMVASNILTHMQRKYAGRWMQCEVSEDGESGAIVQIDAGGNIL